MTAAKKTKPTNTSKKLKPSIPPVDRATTFVSQTIKAVIIDCGVRPSEDGKIIKVKFEIPLTTSLLMKMPNFVSVAVKSSKSTLKNMNLSSLPESVSVNLARSTDNGNKIKVETATLSAGTAVKFGGLSGITPCAYINMVFPYKSERLRWFGDHLDSWVSMKMESVKSLQHDITETIAPIKSRKPNTNNSKGSK